MEDGGLGHGENVGWEQGSLQREPMLDTWISQWKWQAQRSQECLEGGRHETGTMPSVGEECVPIEHGIRGTGV